MKDRILQLMQREQMAQKEFAVHIGVSPSTMSNILNGKSEVSQKVISCIHQRYPKISIPWLMFGEGEMFLSDKAAASEPSAEGKDLFSDVAETIESAVPGTQDKQPKSAESELTERTSGAAQTGQTPSHKIIETIKYIDKPQKFITEIRIFYSDGTYESFQRNET